MDHLTIKRPVLRYLGGKFRIAQWVISHFPPHRRYVEPFGGAASVLMSKPISADEIYNDLNGDVVNLMRVLRDEKQREKLIEMVALTPYSREEFVKSFDPTDEPVERARRTIIRAEIGFRAYSGDITNTHINISTESRKVWSRIPDHLAVFGKRLRGVLIEQMPAIKIIEKYDSRETLFYFDPPYVTTSRIHTSSSARYSYEMELDDHADLLEKIKNIEGMAIISGYPNALYDDALSGWRKANITSRVAAGKGVVNRTEVLWVSPKITDMTGFALV